MYHSVSLRKVEQHRKDKINVDSISVIETQLQDINGRVRKKFRFVHPKYRMKKRYKST